jgi:hypothetical protein
MLDLHNFNDLQNKIKNKLKAKQILKFYKVLAKMIVFFNNTDIRNTQKHIQEYNEPYIKLRKNLFVFRDATSNNEIVQKMLSNIFPPSLEIDFEFKMDINLEQKAVNDFVKTFKIKPNMSYKEMKKLYYSTKITNFINSLNDVLHDNIMWNKFIDKKCIKTKYVPNISITNSVILSLN